MESIIVYRLALPTIETLMVVQAIAWCGIGVISAILVREIVKCLSKQQR
jgi:hypothetical protein